MEPKPPEPPLPPARGRHTESELVLPEGIEAGLVGGTAVVLAFLVRDLLLGDWLHTPSVLGVFLFEGAEAARATVSAPAYAGVYHVVHYAAWIVVGFLGTAVARSAEREPRRRVWLLVLLALLVVPFVGLEVAVPRTGLGRSHLALGAVAGAVALGAYLVWRHPALLRRTGGTGSA